MSVVIPDPATTDWVPLSYGAAIQTNVPACKAKKNAAFSCPNAAFTPVPFDQLLWDSDNMYASGSSRLTCRTAGKYVVVGDGMYTPNATGAHRLVAIMQNGAIVSCGGVVTGSMGSGAQRVNVSAEVNLAVGDYVELAFFQDSGTANSVGSDAGGGPLLAASYIGPGLLGRGVQNLTGPYLSRPAANTVPPGSTYFATDTYGTWLSDGSSWQHIAQRPILLTTAQMNGAPYTTPYHDQEICLLDGAASYVWTFRYNASDGGAYKWYCVGGAPLVGYSAADQQVNVINTWTNIVGSTIIAPRSGNYVLAASIQLSHPQVATSYAIFWQGSLPGGVFGPGMAAGFPSAGGYSQNITIGPFLAQLAAGNGIGLAAQTNVVGGHFSYVQWSMMPLKIA